MPEDAPVNTGAVVWPHPDSAYFAVREMQIKLHRWAGGDPSLRFGDLFNLVYEPAFLVHAWERVSTNRGARTPGVDKATAARIETWIGVEVFLGQIRDSLKSGGFRPVEVRQVMIPKANGKLRKLGIPTIADRVVQASLKLVLEPIFEADFKPCSYGFRPNRRAQDAISEIHLLASRPSNYQWVLECDIKACFDEISHTALMERLRARIKDKQICALVKAFLKSGVLTELGDREDTLTGTPQGGSATRGRTVVSGCTREVRCCRWCSPRSVSGDRSSPRRALLVTAGCGARGKAGGFPFHPGATGERKAGGVNDSEPSMTSRDCGFPVVGCGSGVGRGWPLGSGRCRPGQAFLAGRTPSPPGQRGHPARLGLTRAERGNPGWGP